MAMKLSKEFDYCDFFLMALGVQRRQLLTIFALSVKYRAVDVSLAVSCGILPLLFCLCGSPGVLMQTGVNLFNGTGHANLRAILKMASLNLLQILSMTARFVGFSYCCFCYMILYLLLLVYVCIWKWINSRRVRMRLLTLQYMCRQADNRCLAVPCWHSMAATICNGQGPVGWWVSDRC